MSIYFDPNAEIEGEDELGGDFPLIPDGTTVRCEYAKIEMKDTRAGGTGLNTEATIIAPVEFKGRKVWDFVNLTHPTSKKAAAIGQRHLRDVCRAIGHGGPVRDWSDLCGVPFVAVLKIEPARDGYEAKNRIKKVLPPDDGGKADPAPAGKAHAPTRGSWG